MYARPSRPLGLTRREERADRGRTAGGRVECRAHPHEPREVVRAAGRRQGPHVLELEVGGDVVDAPGPLGVRGAGEPHRVAAAWRISASPTWRWMSETGGQTSAASGRS